MDDQLINDLIETLALTQKSVKDAITGLNPVLDAAILQAQKTEKSIEALNPALDALILSQTGNTSEVSKKLGELGDKINTSFENLKTAIEANKPGETKPIDLQPLLTALENTNTAVANLKLEVAKPDPIDFTPVLNAITGLGEALRKTEPAEETDLTGLQATIASFRDAIAGGIKAEFPSELISAITSAIQGIQIQVPPVDVSSAWQGFNTTAIEERLGAKDEVAATTDTGTFSLISLFKRLLQKFTTGLTILFLPIDTYSVKEVDCTTTAATDIVDPTGSAKVRLYYICLAADGANSVDTVATVKFGSTVIYKIPLKAGALWARNIGAGRRYLAAGSNGEKLTVELSAAATVYTNVEYDTI